MKNTFFLLLIFAASCFANAGRAQSVTICDASNCYYDSPCYPNIAAPATYTFATVHNVYKSATANIDLKMDVYSPCTLPNPITNTVSDPNCNGCKRPFILLIHAGAFRVGCRSAMASECIEFAQRGYVAATIDYRLGWVPGDQQTGNCNGDRFCYPDSCAELDKNTCKAIYKDSNQFAVYRAIQDAHAALRFIVHYASQLNIDVNSIYIGGQSAGAVTAVNLAYVSQSEINSRYPNIMPVLGRIDTAGNSFTNDFTISGVYNNWGAVMDTTFINGTVNRIPMIAFHGWNDNVVPYVKANFLSCSFFDSSCGSYAIYKRLTRKYPNLPVELFSDKGGHGILQGGGGISLYRVQKAVCFFRNAKMGGTDTNFVQRPEADNTITLSQLQTWFPLNCGIISTARKLNPAVYEDEANIATGPGNTVVCHYTLSAEKQVEINVFDMTGRKVNTFKTTQPAGQYTYQSDAITMPGVYVAVVSINGLRTAAQKVSVGH